MDPAAADGTSVRHSPGPGGCACSRSSRHIPIPSAARRARVSLGALTQLNPAWQQETEKQCPARRCGAGAGRAPRGPSPAAVTAHHILLAPRRVGIPGCVSPILPPHSRGAPGEGFGHRWLQKRLSHGWTRSGPLSRFCEAMPGSSYPAGITRPPSLPGSRTPHAWTPSPRCSHAGTGLATSTCTECCEGASGTARQAPRWLSAPFPASGRRRSRARCPLASAARGASGAGPSTALCPHTQPPPAPAWAGPTESSSSHRWLGRPAVRWGRRQRDGEDSVLLRAGARWSQSCGHHHGCWGTGTLWQAEWRARSTYLPWWPPRGRGRPGSWRHRAR